MSSGQRPSMGWSGRLLIGLVLLIVGAAAMTWGLNHFPAMARVLGVASAPASVPARPAAALVKDSATDERTAAADAPDDGRMRAIEQRLGRIENTTQTVVGSAGRADALVVAFAARRAIDRGVALGYLEPLLVQRFGAQQQAVVGTIVTAARQPVTLGELIDQYRSLGPVLRTGGSSESWWTGFKREMGGLIQVRSADRPSATPNARYDRALEQLVAGNVDSALAETMRMPGAAGARPWIDRARRYVAAQRALDQLESAALLGDGRPAP